MTTITHSIDYATQDMPYDATNGDVKKINSLYTEALVRLSAIRGTHLLDDTIGTYVAILPNELLGKQIIVETIHDIYLSYQPLIDAKKIANLQVAPTAYLNGVLDLLIQFVDIETGEEISFPWSL